MLVFSVSVMPLSELMQSWHELRVATWVELGQMQEITPGSVRSGQPGEGGGGWYVVCMGWDGMGHVSVCVWMSACARVSGDGLLWSSTFSSQYSPLLTDHGHRDVVARRDAGWGED